MVENDCRALIIQNCIIYLVNEALIIDNKITTLDILKVDETFSITMTQNKWGESF